MRHIVLAAAFTGLMLLCAVPASAGIYSIVPSPSGDLWDLDHYKAYRWGINFNIPAGETITNAVLTYKGIYDWIYEDHDQLVSTLLDNAPSGVAVIDDNQGGGDYFLGQGPRIGLWNDPFGDYAHRTTLNYDFSKLGLVSDLNKFAANGNFGIGVDPDCHYFNTGVELKIITGPSPNEPVPEPGTLSLVGVGVAGLGYFRNRFRSR